MAGLWSLAADHRGDVLGMGMGWKYKTSGSALIIYDFVHFLPQLLKIY